jgi:hypothetical protein
MLDRYILKMRLTFSNTRDVSSVCLPRQRTSLHLRCFLLSSIVIVAVVIVCVFSDFMIPSLDTSQRDLVLLFQSFHQATGAKKM